MGGQTLGFIHDMRVSFLWTVSCDVGIRWLYVYIYIYIPFSGCLGYVNLPSFDCETVQTAISSHQVAFFFRAMGVIRRHFFPSRQLETVCSCYIPSSLRVWPTYRCGTAEHPRWGNFWNCQKKQLIFTISPFTSRIQGIHMGYGPWGANAWEEARGFRPLSRATCLAGAYLNFGSFQPCHVRVREGIFIHYH